jgi:hypothetical protein
MDELVKLLEQANINYTIFRELEGYQLMFYPNKKVKERINFHFNPSKELQCVKVERFDD